MSPAEDQRGIRAYRGRAGLPQAAQAAGHFLRTHTGIGSVAAVTIESVRDAQVTEAQVTEVVLLRGRPSEQPDIHAPCAAPPGKL